MSESCSPEAAAGIFLGETGHLKSVQKTAATACGS